MKGLEATAETFHLREASRAQVGSIAAGSHVVWGGGLSREDYLGLWDEIGRTAWARRHSRHLVWQDDAGRVLSSVKIHRPLIRVGPRSGRCSVLGAVFTPRALRGRGHATRMVEACLRESRDRGDVAALLFSDIGTGYYQRFGFIALPALETVGRMPVPTAGVREAFELRPAHPADLPLLRAAHDVSSAAWPLAIVRDDEHWEYLWLRARSFFARFTDPTVHQSWRVAQRDGRFEGYVICVEGRGEWNVREVGSADGRPETMARIVACAAALAYRSGLRRIHGWVPPEVLALLEGWPEATRRRRRALPMLWSPDASIDAAALGVDPTVHLPFQDQF